ncbi:MAG: PorP/SprF family type IX secretion system membrane protein [Muribaculaceae bacterium]|nr:PorP/SprF family type IX secretion system membrane protein [Muribaculaceae bacterium]
MKRLLPILMILTSVIAARAEMTDPSLTQYFQAPSLFNPAAAGSTDLLRIRAGSRMQWIGINGAPRDFMATADIPFKLINRRWGGGVAMIQESIGLYQTLSLGAQLSARQKIGRGFLSVGIQAAYLNQQFKGSKVVIPDDDDFHESTDEAIPTIDVTGQGFDLGLGLTYTHRWFTVGLACTHLLSPELKLRREGDQGSSGSGDQEWLFRFDRTLYFTAESNIPIKNTLFEVLPSLLVRSDFASFQADVTARLRWKKFLTAGFGYRTEDAVCILLQGEFKGFTLGYSYDYSLSPIMRASSGSHEVWLGYSLKLNFGEKNRNRHKSIRLM